MTKSNNLKYWITKDGKRVKWSTLTDSHLKNTINMLIRESNPLLKYAQNEEYSREIIDLLKSNREKLAWWLTSPNQKMRELAERAKSE